MPTLTKHHSLTEVFTPVSSETPTLRFGHLERLLTDIGLWQHTAFDEPNERHGYSIDDEARGLIVALHYWRRGVETKFNRRMGQTCFQFIENAAITEGEHAGRFHNFCDAQGRWLDSIGSDDSFGRTVWGLGVAHAVNAPFAPRAEAERLLRRSLTVIDSLHPGYLRAKAFVILGLAEARIDDACLRGLAEKLICAYEHTADSDWRWFEPHMTYCNARLPQALFAAALLFPDDSRCVEVGTEALDFLLRVSRTGKGLYAPIGNAPLATAGWFQRGDKHPPQFDQQPVDAGALVEACALAYRVTGHPRFRRAAQDAFGWYFGDNVHGLSVYNPETGAVADALNRAGLNRNQGAESVLSIHLAHQALQTLDHESTH